MDTRPSAAALALTLLLAGNANAQTRPPTDDVPALRLLVAVNDQPGSDQKANAEGMGARLTRYINAAIARPSAPSVPTKSIAIVQPPPGGAPLDPDGDPKGFSPLFATTKAQAALVADVRIDGDDVSTRATLVVPQETATADPWTVRYGDKTVALPLAFGEFAFSRVSVRPKHVAPVAQTPIDQVLGLFAQPLRLVCKETCFGDYASQTEIDVTSFTAGVMAYHAGDFARAETLFAEAYAVEPTGSNTRADAAVLQLASAARAAPARSQAKGRDAITFLSGELHRVDSLGDRVVAEFPYSVEARKVLVAFHLAVASQAPDDLFAGSWTRAYERHAAKTQLKALDLLLSKPDDWSKNAHAILDALDD
jgi:hypothetical protein